MKKTAEKFRLVLADDDLDDCEMFRLALEQIGGNIALEVFHNGKLLLEYLEALDSELPHLVFLDLNMPIMSGHETLREIRTSRKLDALSVAIYSTSSSERDIELTLSLGANVYINKPSSFKKLHEILRKVLEANWQVHSSGLNRNTFCLSV